MVERTQIRQESRADMKKEVMGEPHLENPEVCLAVEKILPGTSC